MIHLLLQFLLGLFLIFMILFLIVAIYALVEGIYQSFTRKRE